MKKIISLALFPSVMVVCLSAAQAQESGVRGDYERYEKLFKAGRDPDFATDFSWRGAYSRNEWRKYADGTEFKDPLPEAQVLSGIYLIEKVGRETIQEIENIVLNKSLLSKTLSETIVLDQIAAQMEADMMYYADGELVGDRRGINFNMEKVLRQRLVSGVPLKATAESKAISNLFRPDIEGGWAAKYRSIREQISALDTLADSFAFNWNDKRKEEELNRLMENAGVQKLAEQKAKLEIESQPKALNAAEILDINKRTLQETANEELEKIVTRHAAHKYIIGVYKGRDYHVGNLEKIYHYYLSAAEKGNSIAQYHVALFLIYFGDILGMDKADIKRESEGWMQKAFGSDLAHKRVEEFSTYREKETKQEQIDKRVKETGEKIEKLIRLEHERMDMVDNVLIQTAKRVARINEVQKRIIEEMERERERQSITIREYIRAMAMVEAARLESMRPIILQFQRR